MPPDMNPVVFLIDYETAFERQLLCNWIEKTRPPDYFGDVRIVDATIAAVEAMDTRQLDRERSWLQPLRLAWLPSVDTAKRGVTRRLIAAMALKPGWLRQRFIARCRSNRLAYIAADGATLSGLDKAFAERGQRNGENSALPQFIIRQATVSLERSERVTRGARYKIARLLSGDVFANPKFRKELEAIAADRNLSAAEVQTEASKYLTEMAALQTPFTLDLATALYRGVCSANHDPGIDVDSAELALVKEKLKKQPVVFLISHKSMLDTAALSLVLYDNNQPLPLTFGGINLNTPGVGQLARRAGIIFLRRSFQDNPVYKSTFRRYIEYLIEKRFSLLWALEGTRSRTGKLLPPRFGLFNYVVDSILATANYDVAFIPVSVAYDQITEVADYSREQMGQDKKPEGKTWILRFFKRSTNHGKIFLRFGDAIQVDQLMSRKTLDAGLDAGKKQVLVQTLAFQAAVGMNRATPITTSAILTLILLAGGTRAQSLSEIQTLARAGAAMIRRRKLEIVGAADFKDENQVRSTLDQLEATGIVTVHKGLLEPLFSIAPEQHHKAAYYRNTAIHYFVLDAIIELMLVSASRRDSDRRKVFLEGTDELRELFKFEFYFPRRGEYRQEIEKRTNDRFPDWESALERGRNGIEDMLRHTPPLLAHGVLRAFVDAYRIVAEGLVRSEDREISDKAAFVATCLRFGRQLQLQGEVFSAESVSKSLFDTALRIAEYRNLTAAGTASERAQFLEELRYLSNRLDEILQITLSLARKHQRRNT